MDLRAEDGGRSECLPVMGRIGIELGECAVRAVEKVHYPTRKRADFLTWSLVTREFVRTIEEGNANDGGGNTSWCTHLWGS